eukprot:CAMPEP_0182443780 /NCGR_PEP_ID=MMETSP1172-20130603/2415_1 /TAXON_ID=708627 /ORGANISM="Timspurckia oligopyrenoides, Strain CCMP3278" /LENGTH=281 /DNA_ID=CAMNT_0024639153 /DNA_START=268 /DNA_END=1113 /DNA_ORIENTATION=-
MTSSGSNYSKAPLGTLLRVIQEQDESPWFFKAYGEDKPVRNGIDPVEVSTNALRLPLVVKRFSSELPWYDDTKTYACLAGLSAFSSVTDVKNVIDGAKASGNEFRVQENDIIPSFTEDLLFINEWILKVNEEESHTLISYLNTTEYCGLKLTGRPLPKNFVLAKLSTMADCSQDDGKTLVVTGFLLREPIPVLYNIFRHYLIDRAWIEQMISPSARRERGDPRSRFFLRVRMRTQREAERAVREKNRTYLRGRILHVTLGTRKHDALISQNLYRGGTSARA